MTKEELQNHIKEAMKAKDKVRLSILRQMSQALKQIEVDERRDVTEADLTAVVKKLMKVTSEELDNLRKLDNAAHVDRIASLTEQLAILQSTLPKQLSGDELEALCKQVCEELGATTRRDMGRVMGRLTDATNGNFNKPEAAQMLGKLLS